MLRHCYVLSRLFNYNSLKLSYALFCNIHLIDLHLSNVCFVQALTPEAGHVDEDVNESFGHDDYYNVYSSEERDKKW